MNSLFLYACTYLINMDLKWILNWNNEVVMSYKKERKKGQSKWVNQCMGITGISYQYRHYTTLHIMR